MLLFISNFDETSISMRKWLWIPALILLLFLGDRLAGGLLNSLVLNSEFRYSRMYRGEAAADILLLGNSRGLVFYQPYIEEKTGKKTFNLSYNGMPADLADVLLKDYLTQYGKPKLVLIDVTLCDRINQELVNGFATYAGQSDRLKSLIRQQDQRVANGLEISHLFRYNSEVFQRALYYRNRTDEDWLVDRVITNELKKKLTPDYDFIIRYPEEMPIQLGKTIRYLKEEGINAQLLVNPYYPPFVEHITNLDTFIQAIEIATESPILNYATAIQEEIYFGDFQHLNVEGCKAYIDLLLKEEVLPSK